MEPNNETGVDGTATINPKVKSNIILMGPPGSGKTSCGRRIGEKLKMKWIDVDDDLLEKEWKCPVSQKLSELGDELFVKEEGKVLRSLNVENTVISLTGSNPLDEEAMKHMKEGGIVYYLDVYDQDILERLEKMKVNRIVGQGSKSLSSILAYRKSFYESFYDVRVLLGINASADQVFEHTLEAIERYRKLQENTKTFSSTRSLGKEDDLRLSFGEVVLQGLSPDGGLYLPEHTPSFHSWELERLVKVIEEAEKEGESNGYRTLALRLLERWAPEVHPSLLKQFIDNAYQFPNRFDHKDVAPVAHLEGNQYLLELFHGPTASFKDFALQLFPQIFDHYSKILTPNTQFAILVSTSGDTGSATVHGFCEQTPIPVICLYPEDGVSPVQKYQMVTSSSSNLSVMGVESDFDFCQSSIKSIFNDTHFTHGLAQFGVKLSAANSINWGRLLPQVLYHTWAYLLMVKRGEIKLGEEIDVCVPTGNFGNILSALYAKMAGIPFRKLICAANENDVLREFLQTGTYDIRTRNLKKTSSPSIDILKSSNLERLLFLLSSKEKRFRIRQYFESLEKDKHFTIDADLKAEIDWIFWTGSCNDAQTQETITKVFKSTKTVLDPHTAVAKFVADEYDKTLSLQEGEKDTKLVICSTAHYSKFPCPVLSAVGVEPLNTVAEQIAQLKELKAYPQMHKEVEKACTSQILHKKVCGPKVEDIKSEVEGFLQSKYKK
eukprot:TRINITY_DN1726_c0_g2_i8.p1 TRINITY_DN1726_c0_g2~~TRINITY_DN1726_c0_g2_i8.p1  ORF type:complete len:721 (-),score=212.11 TRINITY_DN1726_c0_g2_i8:218-2380(-)